MPAADASGFSATTYGDGFADVYDEWYGHITDAEATAAFVAARAVNENIAELGVGSGRLVSALLAEGLRVLGVDASSAMLAKCQEATEGKGVDLVQADLGLLPLRAGSDLGAALCAFNTLFNLQTESAQRAFFERAGSALAPNGVLVVEAVTGAGLNEGPVSSVGVSRMEVDRLVLSATVTDAEAQTLTGQHVDITEAGIRLRPWRLRWSTPAQLDAIAESVGLQISERFGGWNEDPFTEDSDIHISCYQLKQ